MTPHVTADRDVKWDTGGKERGREKTRTERNPRGHFSLENKATSLSCA